MPTWWTRWDRKRSNATQAPEKYNIEKDIAAYIKKEFDKKFGSTRHCIVRRDLGSHVTHETRHFVFVAFR
ncbi:hypothetical protein QR680_012426 [Steinernema hermaphroditum]|uniref:Dynein light chain n=1 Tax=Steinernema hermaphroditum TaxID=289476 RepID=A0AA39I3Y7_9BILA|nr:hypothetical protein QR680_012426 [Steinernema hermaphroditum]